MNSLALLSIGVTVIFGIAGSAWLFVIRWTLLQRMAAIERSDAALAALETRIETQESRPDGSDELQRAMNRKFEEVESTIRAARREISELDVAYKKLQSRDAARERWDRNKDKKGGEDGESAPSPAGGADPGNIDWDALAASGSVVPLSPSASPASPSNGERPRPQNFGQFGPRKG